jgi:L-asparaginase
MNAFKPLRPRVALLALGGTIASSGQSGAQLQDYQVDTKIVEMLANVPLMNDLADFECEQISNIASHQIDDRVLVPLARRVQDLCDRSDIDAVVITHGTDTLEETAYFLHLAVQTEKPIVLVGAMRPATTMSADGPLNLFHATAVAIDPQSRAQGVLVVMNDRIASARHVTKGHANGVEAFVPTEFGYLGLVSGTTVRFQNKLTTHHTQGSEFARLGSLEALPAVDIIYDHQGAGVHHFSASVQAGIRGIVLAATGQGSLSPQAEAGVKLARAQGLSVVRASRVWQGWVRPGAKDSAYGLVAAQTLNPAKARILLRLALSKTEDPDALQQYFDRY